jgi:hypothetical protein
MLYLSDSDEDLNKTDASIAVAGDDRENNFDFTVQKPLTEFVFNMEVVTLVVRISKSSITERCVNDELGTHFFGDECGQILPCKVGDLTGRKL